MNHSAEPTGTVEPAPEPGTAPRPLQSVLEFLETEIERTRERPRRLPTIRDVALHLQVSPRTVQKAFRQLASEGRIESATGRGSFTVPPAKQTGRQLLVALSIEFDQDDTVNAWAYTIYGAILQAALTSGRNALFTTVEETLRHSRTSTVDGFILLPDRVGIRERLRQQQPQAPAVFLNPSSFAATANFISPDYYRVGFTLGHAWKRCGKKRIVFMHHPSLESSASGQLLISGLISGLGWTCNDLEYLHIVEAANLIPEAGYEAMRDFLRQQKRAPDAVFCKGDFIALGALRALEEAGCSSPAEVSVVGGSGLDLSETESPQLTRCRQPFQQLGEALFAMLVARIEQGGAPQPGRFLPTPFIGGATTTARENEFLLEPEKAAAPPVITPAP